MTMMMTTTTTTTTTTTKSWIPTLKENSFGVVLYNFPGSTAAKFELSLHLGDTVHIMEHSSGWYHGYALKYPRRNGIFPSSYVQVNNQRFHDALSEEIVCVLQEWRVIWRRLFVLRNDVKLSQIQRTMENLIEMRRMLMQRTLTLEQTRELKLRIAEKIDWGNRLLGLDLAPREDDGGLTSIQKHGVFHIFDVHSKCEKKRLHLGEVKSSIKSIPKSENHHVHVILREISYPILGQEDSVEVRFSLYSLKQSAYVSEAVVIQPPSTMNKGEKGAIFIDVGTREQLNDLYLVVHVIRIGRMLLGENRKVSSTLYKRPFAVGVLNISKIANYIDIPTMQGFETKLFVCEDKDFHHLHELIIKKNNNNNNFGRYSAYPGGPNSALSVDVELLLGEIGQIRRERQLLFSSIPEVRPLGFPIVIMPGDVRNDLYLTIEKGIFERGGKAAARNIEVTTVVIDKEGNIIPGCIFSAAGKGQGESKVTSFVLYHTNSPIWADTMRLQIPIEQFYGAHVRLEYRHCSTKEKSEKKLLGFSFVHLMELDETTIKDGSHVLCTYKCEEPSKLNDPNIYLPLASRLEEVPSLEQVTISQGFVRSTKESVTVRTKLCSTKLTQNVNLMSLLKWKSNTNITDTLNKIMKLGGEEIVKFLQDVLDALFSMFSTEDGNSTAHSGLVFHVLVSIISYLEDPKFEHFRPIMDTYISEHFAAALVYKGLLSCVRHCADLVTSTDKQEPIQKCFKSLEYIAKFVIQSRLLFARATDGQNEDSFRVDVHLLFNSFNKMLGSTYNTILPTQIVFLKHISAIYPHFLRLLPVIDIAKLVTLLFDSVCSDSRLIEAKLIAIHRAINGPVFQDSESRAILLSTSLCHIKRHLLEEEELRMCSEILGDIITFLHLRNNPNDDEIIIKDIEVMAKIIFEPLIKTLLQTDRIKSSKTTMHLISCLMGTLELMNEDHFIKLWDHFGSRKTVKDFLLQGFLLFRDLVTQELFPSDWSVMRTVVASVSLKAIHEFARPLLLYFKDEVYFDSQLWTNYFTLGVAFLSQSALQLEKFSEIKRQRILKNYGDMRLIMGLRILSLWSQLEGLKTHFIPGMVGPFLEMTLIPQIQLRKSTLPLFYDLLDCESRTKGNFKQVEIELIDKLDILVSENKGDEEYKELFNVILLDSLIQRDPPWGDSGKAFIISVTRLLERLLDYRNVIQGDENRDKRMSCTVNLLNFYQSEINRQEMYLRYIYKLHDLHIPAENYTEAGFTLKLHADQLAWSNKTLHSDLRYPTQKEWQRKELLYLKILEYFDKGKQWEHAIPLTKELGEFYEHKIFNYKKLSDILRRQAKFFEKIISLNEEDLRLDPEYFRVGFYGQGFPLFVRNKEFVYRGMECEKLGSFTQRLSTEFPNAEILTTNSTPTDSILNSESQFIQICSVRPTGGELSSDSLIQDLIPEKIRKFHAVNNVDTFQYDRPFHKGPKSAHNEFKTLWIERTTIRICSSLPGILRWFQVRQSHSEEISPIQHACESIESKNEEIRRLIITENTKNLTQSLQGVIDAAVNGGISKYQEAFFSEKEPEEDAITFRLKAAMLEQVNVLESALRIHERVVPNELMPLHSHLVDRLQQMKKGGLPFFDRKTSIINTPLPPLPKEQPLPEAASPEKTSNQIYSKPSDISSANRNSSDYVWQLSSPSVKNSDTIYCNQCTPTPPRPPSIRKNNKVDRDSGHISFDSFEDAPPLPPRSSLRTNLSFSEDRPALPRRVARKILATSDVESELNLSTSSSGSIEAPPVPPKCTPIPPPLPPMDLPTLQDKENNQKM